jgi:hypothetical protein
MGPHNSEPPEQSFLLKMNRENGLTLLLGIEPHTLVLICSQRMRDATDGLVTVFFFLSTCILHCPKQ